MAHPAAWFMPSPVPTTRGISRTSRVVYIAFFALINLARSGNETRPRQRISGDRTPRMGSADRCRSIYRPCPVHHNTPAHSTKSEHDFTIDLSLCCIIAVTVALAAHLSATVFSFKLVTFACLLADIPAEVCPACALLLQCLT